MVTAILLEKEKILVFYYYDVAKSRIFILNYWVRLELLYYMQHLTYCTRSQSE
jgi:hypothetical protein